MPSWKTGNGPGPGIWHAGLPGDCVAEPRIEMWRSHSVANVLLNVAGLVDSVPMRKTAVVTGAGGYIGRHVVSALADRGFRVKALDIRFDGVDERAERLSVDVFSGHEDIYDQLGRPDLVVHLAGVMASSTILRPT